jgi:hypothetical protein
MSNLKPSCFVLMPFGQKKDPSRRGKTAIDFDLIYDEAIEPAIERADMEPSRADQETVGGIIHKPMIERLLLCDFAVADLTLPNPNVYYELGIRHAVRRDTTLLMCANHVRLPFDVAPMRALPYGIGKDNGVKPSHLKVLRDALAKQLRQLRELSRTRGANDSPVHQLLGNAQQSDQLPLDQRLMRIKDADSALYEMLNVYAQHEKSDVFGKVVEYNERRKAQLAAARAKGGDGLADLDAIRAELGVLEQTEAGVIVDLFLSYRSLSRWDRMISLYEEMPAVLKRSVLVREQYALALNRQAAKEPKQPELRDQAAGLLEQITREIGPNPETQGLLGRVNKDRWNEARKSGSADQARGHLSNAIEAYASGFKADWRDAYPGINALTLLAVEGSAASLRQRDELLPVVRFAVQRKLDRSPHYWDHASLLELAVHTNDTAAAQEQLNKALASAGLESFMPKTTADNLSYLRAALSATGQDTAWLEPMIAKLQAKHQELAQSPPSAPAKTRGRRPRKA